MSDVIRPQTFDQAYPGRFLKAGHLPPDRPITLTIAEVWVEQLEGEKGKEPKCVVTFRECSKTTGAQIQLVLAKINAHCVKAMFGSKVADWVGKRIGLYATDKIAPMPTAKGDDRYCVRVWGSPDIERDIVFAWKAPRRAAINLTMRAMRQGASASQTHANTPANHEAPAPVSTPPDLFAGQEGGKACVCPGCGSIVEAAIAEDVMRSGTCPACG